MFDRITIDAFNNSVHVVLDGVNHLFTSYEKFVEFTGYSFEETINLSYEPDRNFYVVERKNGILVTGEDLPEIIWCKDNKENIITAAHSDGYGQLPPSLTLRQIRDGKLYETDWMVTRHKEQVETGISTNLSNDQYVKLLSYRQELRDITTKYTSIDDVIWPILDL